MRNRTAKGALEVGKVWFALQQVLLAGAGGPNRTRVSTRPIPLSSNMVDAVIVQLLVVAAEIRESIARA